MNLKQSRLHAEAIRAADRAEKKIAAALPASGVPAHLWPMVLAKVRVAAYNAERRRS